MLEVGKVYHLGGKPWLCVLVNQCRARIVPGWHEPVEIEQPDGSVRSFMARPTGLDISPNSLIPEWIGADGVHS